MNPHLSHDSERIVTLDILRGFALFGIFYAHMIFWVEWLWRSATDLQWRSLRTTSVQQLKTE